MENYDKLFLHWRHLVEPFFEWGLTFFNISNFDFIPIIPSNLIIFSRIPIIFGLQTVDNLKGLVFIKFIPATNLKTIHPSSTFIFISLLGCITYLHSVIFIHYFKNNLPRHDVFAVYRKCPA